jgi:hypothetical protein
MLSLLQIPGTNPKDKLGLRRLVTDLDFSPTIRLAKQIIAATVYIGMPVIVSAP